MNKVTVTGNVADLHSKLRSAMWGLSLLGSAVVVAGMVSPSAAADRALSSTGQYLIFFPTDSAAITPAAQVIVDKAAEDSAAGPMRIVVRGYSSNQEDEAPNLASDRAASVAQALAAQGAPAQAVRTEDNDPGPTIGSEFTPELNRRVEIVLVKQDPAYSANDPYSSMASLR